MHTVRARIALFMGLIEMHKNDKTTAYAHVCLVYYIENSRVIVFASCVRLCRAHDPCDRATRALLLGVRWVRGVFVDHARACL